jgi:hypothetical protein
MADRGLTTPFRGGGLVDDRPSSGRRLLRSVLLATVMGVGAGAAAFAESAPAPVAIASGANATGADGPSIITLADSAAPATAPTPAPGFVLADNAATAPVFAKNATSASAAPASSAMDHLGAGVWERLINDYKLEWGQAGPPTDPNAPPSRRANLPPQPEASPPMPFTEWPYGGTTNLGTNRTASYDSPLMVAIADTSLGKAMNATGIQLYGWVDYGGNLSSSKEKYGNSPAAYDFQPNSISLDQAVLYLERTPDTVQTDHIDWGFRLSAIYGTNYRYTTAYGVASYQLLKRNAGMGYDFPMVYAEAFIPQVAQGLIVRVGRYISLPDIEAQLAPNNYMYTHSITYTLDNYTNEGVQATLQATKNLILQLGVSDGTEAAIWNAGVKIPNQYVLQHLGSDPLYPGTSFLKDPGAQPTVTACARYENDSARDNLYLCANGINKGTFGYNNLQWYGLTYYHKFNEQWHIAVEIYNEHQNSVPNELNPLVHNNTGTGIYDLGGTPFSPNIIPFNAPNLAQCKNPAALKCTGESQSALQYLNYQPTPLDNISLRAEYYDDEEGQRTGTATIYYDIGLGWQHWLGPQVELRPEVSYFWSTKPAFDANPYLGVAPSKSYELVWAGDIIWHF